MYLAKPDSALVTSIARSPNFDDSGDYNRLSKWIVLHTMETDEHGSIAENIGAGWFANPAALASAHYNVDNDSIVQGVNEGDYAWASGGIGNTYGVQIEMAGRASQTRAQWLDDYSRAMLERTAALVADICTRQGIPVRVLTDEQVARFESGITTHAALARVFRETNHTDPGPNFPWDFFMERVRAHVNGTGGSVAEPAPAPIDAGVAPARRIAMSGVFYPDRTLEVSRDTDPYSPAVAKYFAGSAIRYDSYILENGYAWISYISWSGERRYIAVGPDDGDAGTTWGRGFFN